MGNLSSSNPTDNNNTNNTASTSMSSPQTPLPQTPTTDPPKTPEPQLPQTTDPPKTLDPPPPIDQENPPTNLEGEAEEEEVGECGFCLYMKGGGCKDNFIEWENCIEEAEKKNENIVDKCFEVTSALKKCMEAHSDYYAPILSAEKAAEEQAVQELEKQKQEQGEGKQEQEEVKQEQEEVKEEEGKGGDFVKSEENVVQEKSD